jgi:hypothetical protein
MEIAAARIKLRTRIATKTVVQSCQVRVVEGIGRNRETFESIDSDCPTWIKKYEHGTSTAEKKLSGTAINNKFCLARCGQAKHIDDL